MRPVIPVEIEDRLDKWVVKLSEKGINNKQMLARAGTSCLVVGIQTPFKNGILGKDWSAGFS